MAVHIRPLNNNCSFLITLTPPAVPETARHPERFPGSFIILVDPWLEGPAKFGHRKAESDKKGLPDDDEFPPPDVVIISQDRPGLFHKASLNSAWIGPDMILAPSGVLNKLHPRNCLMGEDFCRCQRLIPYSSKDPDTLLKITIDPVSATGRPGLATVAYLKPTLSSSHSAIGITYQPPSTALTTPATRTVNLPVPQPHSMHKQPASSVQAPPGSPPTIVPVLKEGPTYPPFYGSEQVKTTNGQPITAQVPLAGVSGAGSDQSQTLLMPAEKTISLLYSPHGVPWKVVEPWASTVLVKKAALPLSVLFHSLTIVQKPWYKLGRVVSTGANGGLELADRLFPALWVGCHDEELKFKGFGLSQRGYKREPFTATDVETALKDHQPKQDPKTKNTMVRSVSYGTSLSLNFRAVKKPEPDVPKDECCNGNGDVSKPAAKIGMNGNDVFKPRTHDTIDE